MQLLQATARFSSVTTDEILALLDDTTQSYVSSFNSTNIVSLQKEVQVNKSNTESLPLAVPRLSHPSFPNEMLQQGLLDSKKEAINFF